MTEPYYMGVPRAGVPPHKRGVLPDLFQGRAFKEQYRVTKNTNVDKVHIDNNITKETIKRNGQTAKARGGCPPRNNPALQAL
jgi:hypothetical protein